MGYPTAEISPPSPLLDTLFAPQEFVYKGREQAVRQALPDSFNWTLFGLAFALLTVPVVDTGLQLLKKKRGDKPFAA